MEELYLSHGRPFIGQRQARGRLIDVRQRRESVHQEDGVLVEAALAREDDLLVRRRVEEIQRRHEGVEIRDCLRVGGPDSEGDVERARR